MLTVTVEPISIDSKQEQNNHFQLFTGDLQVNIFLSRQLTNLRKIGYFQAESHFLRRENKQKCLSKHISTNDYDLECNLPSRQRECFQHMNCRC